MRNIRFKGLLVGLMAGAAIAVSLPAAAADRHHHRGHGRVVVHGHHGRVVVRGHRFRVGHWRHLNAVQRAHWRGGHWWHGRRHGRIGWWWFAGGAWYWYPAAVYPYPADVSAEAVYDYAPEGRSDDSWYYCDNPQGYYPYVKSCNGDWRPVPITPQAGMTDDQAYGTPPGSDDYEGGDEQGGDEDENMDNGDGDEDE